MEKPTKREVQDLIMWAQKYAKNGRWWSGGVNDRFARIVGELEEIREQARGRSDPVVHEGTGHGGVDMEKPTRTEVDKKIAWARKYAKNGRPWAGGINDRFARIVNELEEIKRRL